MHGQGISPGSPRVQEECTNQKAASTSSGKGLIPGFLQPVMPSCLRRWSMSAQMVWLPHCITALLQGIPHPQHSVENFKEEDVMLRMGFGDDVAAVDAASSSHFVPLSAMMRNHKVSDRPVPGESRGPEHENFQKLAATLQKITFIPAMQDLSRCVKQSKAQIKTASDHLTTSGE